MNIKDLIGKKLTWQRNLYRGGKTLNAFVAMADDDIGFALQEEGTEVQLTCYHSPDVKGDLKFMDEACWKGAKLFLIDAVESGHYDVRADGEREDSYYKLIPCGVPGGVASCIFG